MRPRIAAHLLPNWIDAECEVGAACFAGAGELYDSWRAYAHARSAEPGGPPEFAAAMEARGFTVDWLPGLVTTRIRWGLRLRAPAAAERAARVPQP